MARLSCARSRVLSSPLSAAACARPRSQRALGGLLSDQLALVPRLVESGMPALDGCHRLFPPNGWSKQKHDGRSRAAVLDKPQGERSHRGAWQSLKNKSDWLAIRAYTEKVLNNRIKGLRTRDSRCPEG